MQLVERDNAEEYLRANARIAPDQRVVVHELSGGVSNRVLLVESTDPASPAFVLKQAREQLRTREAWFASLERAWREADVLTICQRLLDESHRSGKAAAGLRVETPRILFEDRDNYLFAMTAAPRPHTTWKQQLLEDQADETIAAACGRLLATLHAGSWLDPDVAGQIGDRALFDELRIDPYYRTLARVHPEIGPGDRAADRLSQRHPRLLVHADFSPKNLLVSGQGLMMVDFETGHYGDPAFDLGFFLSHLVLKACFKIPRHEEYLRLSERFRESYNEAVASRIPAAELSALWSRGVQNFAACAWARLDGKSPVEYLSDEGRRRQMRQVCRRIFDDTPRQWTAVVELCRQSFSGSAE